MTGICGVFDVSSQKECLSDLKIMLHTFDTKNSDIISSWSNERIAFGQATLHITPESYFESLPLQNAEKNLTIIGDIRLDNRDELFLKLSVPKSQQQGMGDGSLILLAYQQWKENFVKFLLGDFAFALWDNERKCLFCAVDHLGLRSIFYHFDGKRFSFASTPNQLIALNRISATLNFNKLATLIFPESKHLFWNESWFEGVYPLSGGHLLCIDKNGLNQQQYWSPTIKGQLRFKNDMEYAEAFQELMFRSVGDRMRSHSPVTALLSGGLDSSSVVSIAAKILADQNKELTVFSAVLPKGADPDLVDERYYIDQFKSHPNIKINYITAKNHGFLSNIEDLNLNIYAPNLISRHYLYSAFFNEAKTIGSRVLLDGGGGELGPSYYGDGFYAELLGKFKWWQLFKELNYSKKLNGESIRRNLFSKALRPHIPSDFISLFKKSPAPFDRVIPSCIRSTVAKSLKENLEFERNYLNNLVRSKSLSSSVQQNQLKLWQQKQVKSQGTGDLGEIDLRFPLMDKRLLEFCLSLPANFKVRNGYRRFSLRAGLDQILPSEIQWRTSKGAFSPDYNVRYNEQLVHARAYINAINENDPIHDIVDVNQLKRWLEVPLTNTEFNTFAERVARDYIPQGIYLIQFLRRFKDFQTTNEF